MLLWRRYISYLFINIGIIISISVVLKKIKITFIHIYLRCCKVPKRYSSNSSNISDYVNMIEITLTQHYTRLAYNRFPEQKILGNDRMETVRTEATPIRRRNGIEKSTWRTNRYFVDFELRIRVKISTSNRCHNFHVDLPFKIDEISTKFPRRISTSNRWQIDEDVSIGLLSMIKKFLALFTTQVFTYIFNKIFSKR